MMDRLRAQPPSAVQARALQRAVDYWDETQFGKIRSETDRSSRNFVQLQYDQGVHISVRPSGTEPKIKFYVEQVFNPEADWAGDGFTTSRRAMDDAASQVTLGFVEQVLRLVDLVLPRPALLVSSLVSLDNRIDFATRFLPELEERLRTVSTADADRLLAWVDERLKAYGTDPRYLVAAGVAAYFRDQSLSPDQHRMLRRLFSLP
jgi:hypothetical protein